MSESAADDTEQPVMPDAPMGYLTLVARVWVDGRQEGARVRGSLTDAHTGATVPLDLTALVTFLRTSLHTTSGEPIDRPPY